jgi:hypothetical protein
VSLRTSIGGGTCALLGSLALALSTASTASPTGHPATVKPRAGGSQTTFVVRFQAKPSSATMRWLYTVSAKGPHPGEPGCTGQIARRGVVHVGERFRVLLAPGTEGWCTGRFNGTVTGAGFPVCRAGLPCPAYVIAYPTQQFSFRVR